MLLTFILKIIRLLNLVLKILKTDDNKIIEVNSKTDKRFKNLSNFQKLKNKKSKNPIYI